MGLVLASTHRFFVLLPQHACLTQHNLMKSVIDFCNLCQLTNTIGRCLLSHLCRCIKNDSFWPLSYPSDYREYKPFSCPRRISHYSRTLPRALVNACKNVNPHHLQMRASLMMWQTRYLRHMIVIPSASRPCFRPPPLHTIHFILLQPT